MNLLRASEGRWRSVSSFQRLVTSRLSLCILFMYVCAGHRAVTANSLQESAAAGPFSDELRILRIFLFLTYLLRALRCRSDLAGIRRCILSDSWYDGTKSICGLLLRT
jgi:hypothetical protein